MRPFDEVKAHLQEHCGVRWTEDHARQAKVSAGKTTAGSAEQALQLLNGETYFFRYPIYLQILRNKLKKHAEQKPGTPFRVCSAGCSTGEEAYSVAFALHDAAAEAGCRLEVIGLDVRPEAIRIAKSGRYRNWSLRNRQTESMESFLLQDGAGWEVREKYKKVVQFNVQNLLQPLTIEAVQAVMICNVLLYMHESAVRSVYSNLAGVLGEDGILLIAPTDPAPGDSWSPIDETTGWPVFVRRKEAPARQKSEPAPVRRKAPRKRPVAAAIVDPKPSEEERAHAADEELLWRAWARGELKQMTEIVRRKLFFEPDHPLWRFLNAVLMWENGWLRKSAAEMQRSLKLLGMLPPNEVIAGLCTAEELRSLIEFWRRQHG